MTTLLTVLTVAMAMTQWNYVTSRYVPSSGSSRIWQTARHNTQRSWQSERTWPPNQTWSQRLYKQAKRNRVTSGPLRTSPNSPRQPQRQSRILPVESRNRLYLHRSHNQRAVSSRIPTRIAQTSYHISVSNDDTDHSHVTFRGTQIRHRTVNQNKQSHIRRQIFGPNRIMNTSFKERSHFLGHRTRNVRRPLHNIVIKTKTGRKIKISHSFGKTNIVLNTTFASKHRNAIPNIHPEQKKIPVTKSVVDNISQHEKPAMVDLKKFNGSSLTSDHITSQSAAFIKSEMTKTHLENITQQSITGLTSTRNPSRYTKRIGKSNDTLITLHPENARTTNTTPVLIDTTASLNIISNTNVHKTDGTAKSISVTSTGLDSTQQNSRKNTVISKTSHKFSHVDASISDDVSHDMGHLEAPGEDVDGLDTPDSSDPTDK